MAFLNDTLTRGDGLGARWTHLVERVRAHRAQTAIYRRTYDELSSLTDRELSDIGISRADIPTIARQAAEGVA